MAKNKLVETIAGILGKAGATIESFVRQLTLDEAAVLALHHEPCRRARCDTINTTHAGNATTLSFVAHAEQRDGRCRFAVDRFKRAHQEFVRRRLTCGNEQRFGWKRWSARGNEAQHQENAMALAALKRCT